jgi:hypothetical protein
LSDDKGVKSEPCSRIYSYIFSISVGAQWTQWTGWPIEESVFQAANIEEEDGGHVDGGNERIWPFGRLERAMEMPAMWYLEC